MEEHTSRDIVMIVSRNKAGIGKERIEYQRRDN